MKYKKLVSALLFSALSFCSVEAALSQTSGMPSPVDGQPLSDEPDGFNFNLVFGDDDRRPMRSNAFPWSAVGRVQIDGAGHCTGALIGRDLVLTNAHCIWVDGQRRGVTFAPNYRNGQAPETVRGINYWWGTSDADQNRRADWALIRLERPIGDRYGWFDWQPVNYQELQGRTVTYVGYSTFGDETVQEFINGETAQVHVGCRVRNVYPDDGVVHTDCDNGRGGSGGPIFVWQNNRPVIVAINAAEFRGGSNTSFFAQDYTPGQGNVGVPTLTFSQTIREVTALPSARNDFVQDGFYRVNAAGAVWQLYTENGTPKACGIASGEHLANLGGEGRVSALSDIGTGRTWTGTCRIADGFYRVNAAGVVWQLYTENGTSMACGIASGEHLARRGGANRVRTVPSGAEAGAQRNWAGTCPS